MFLLAEQGPGRVTDLRVTHTNSRRIRIAWSGVTAATGYRVSWRQGNSKYNVSVSLSYKSYLQRLHPIE